MHSAAANENAIAGNSTHLNSSQLSSAHPISTSTPLLSDDEILADVKAMAEVMDAVEQAGFGRSVAVASTVSGMVAEYGHDAVKAGVQQCVEQGVVKLAYLRKVLENRRNGVEKPKPQATATRGKRVSENDYEQREYQPGSARAAYMDELKRFKEECGATSSGAAAPPSPEGKVRDP